MSNDSRESLNPKSAIGLSGTGVPPVCLDGALVCASESWASRPCHSTNMGESPMPLDQHGRVAHATRPTWASRPCHAIRQSRLSGSKRCRRFALSREALPPHSIMALARNGHTACLLLSLFSNTASALAQPQHTPWSIIASATLRKPAMFAPSTRLCGWPNSFAVSDADV